MLLGAKSLDTWDKLLSWVTQGHDALNPLVNGILLWQWNIALNQQLPDEFKEEMRGVTAAGVDLGIDLKGNNLGDLIAEATVLANLPGDVDDIV